MISESTLQELERKLETVNLVASKWTALAVQDKNSLSKEDIKKWVAAFSDGIRSLNEITVATCLNLGIVRAAQLHNDAVTLLAVFEARVRHLKKQLGSR